MIGAFLNYLKLALSTSAGTSTLDRWQGIIVLALAVATLIFMYVAKIGLEYLPELLAAVVLALVAYLGVIGRMEAKREDVPK